MSRWNLRASALVGLVALTGCGNNTTEEPPLIAMRSAPLEATSLSAAVSPTDAAEQFLDLAEQTYPGLFPSEQPSLSQPDFRFRHYPDVGTYIAVITSSNLGSGYSIGGVYAMGGPLGDVPRYAGQVESFLAPVDQHMKTAPDLAATFVTALPHSPRGAGQPCSNRAVWAGASARAAFLTERANALLDQPFPPWDQAAYLSSAVSRAPEPGEPMVQERIRWLYPLVIAECAAWTGKYLGRIDEVLKGLASQPTWTSPIGDRDITALYGSPYVLDLFSAATGHEVAQTLYLLGDKIPASTRAQLLSVLKARAVDPARAAVNEGRNDWWLKTNINWNAVLVAGTVGAALAVLPSRYERAWFASLGQHYIQNYIAGFPASGFSTEGPSYWTYGVTYLAMLRQDLHAASAGKVDLFDTPKVQAIGLYANRFTMTPYGTVASIGDAWVPTNMNYAVRQVMDAAYGSQSSGWPQAARLVPLPTNGNDSPIVLASMILTGASVPVVASHRSADSTWPGLHTYFDDVGVLVSRSPLSETWPIAATIKAAGSINHAHDDIGRAVSRPKCNTGVIELKPQLDESQPAFGRTPATA